MKTTLLTFAISMASALAMPAPAPQAGPPAWFPDVWQCRCYNKAQDLPLIQPLCENFGGSDQTLYPPLEPVPGFGRNVWCQKISLKSDPRANRMANVFTDATCQKAFGAGFSAECKSTGYTLCFGEEECV